MYLIDCIIIHLLQERKWIVKQLSFDILHFNFAIDKGQVAENLCTWMFLCLYLQNYLYNVDYCMPLVRDAQFSMANTISWDLIGNILSDIWHGTLSFSVRHFKKMPNCPTGPTYFDSTGYYNEIEKVKIIACMYICKHVSTKCKNKVPRTLESGSAQGLYIIFTQSMWIYIYEMIRPFIWCLFSKIINYLVHYVTLLFDFYFTLNPVKQIHHTCMWKLYSMSVNQYLWCQG